MHRLIVSALGLTFFAVPVTAEPIEVRFDPSRTTIEFTLDATMHSVHGTFQLSSGAVRYDAATGEASGMLVVDARSGNSGNEKRDRDMHAKVLLSEPHPTIVFVPERVIGELPPAGSGDMKVQGALRLAGSTHAVEIPLSVTVAGDELEIRGEFEVPYVAWGLEDPSKFVLRVAKEVAVVITARADVTSPAGDGSE